MELTPEQLEEGKRQFIEQQRLQIELSEKEISYRNETEKKELTLNMDWQNKIEDIDHEYLQASVTIAGIESLDNFSVINVDLEKLVNYHCGSKQAANKTYPKKILWDTCRNNRKITKLISHIKDGKSICPPIAEFTVCNLTKKEVFALYDGNHRIGLSRFLGLKTIPLIVRKGQEDRILNL